jgi:hypothetical protein
MTRRGHGANQRERNWFDSNGYRFHIHPHGV